MIPGAASADSSEAGPFPHIDSMPTTLALLACDEPTARRIAALVDESIETAIGAAFEGDDGLWVASLHFAELPDETLVRGLVAAAAGPEAAAALRFEEVADRDWVAQSLAGLKPVRAGRFIVHGAHDRVHIPANATGIEIEAALAFGTGHHGTTRGCLVALDALVKRDRITPRRRPARGRKRTILDVGTGSGVLAIAAVKALRRKAVATDIDPVAVAAARANLRLNRTAAFVTVRRVTGAHLLRGRYDLVFANILLGPLVRMATPLTRLAAPGGAVVLSGLLNGHAHAALAAYRARGLALERRVRLEGWTTLVLRRPKRKTPRRRPGRFVRSIGI